MQIKDGGSQKYTTRHDPHGFSMRITAKCGIYYLILSQNAFFHKFTHGPLHERFSDEVSAATQKFEFMWSRKTIQQGNGCNFKQDAHFFTIF